MSQHGYGLLVLIWWLLVLMVLLALRVPLVLLASVLTVLPVRASTRSAQPRSLARHLAGNRSSMHS